MRSYRLRIFGGVSRDQSRVKEKEYRIWAETHHQMNENVAGCVNRRMLSVVRCIFGSFSRPPDRTFVFLLREM